MQLKQWELYWEAIFLFKPKKKEKWKRGRSVGGFSLWNPGKLWCTKRTWQSPRLVDWGGLINGGYCQGGLAFVLNTERHQPSKYSTSHNNRLCAVSLRKQTCSLSIGLQSIHQWLALNTTQVYVITDTWNLNIILKQLEQQKTPGGFCFPFALKHPSFPNQNAREQPSLAHAWEGRAALLDFWHVAASVTPPRTGTIPCQNLPSSSC